MIRLSERFVRTDPLVERDERRMVKYINKEIGDHVDTIVKRGFQRVIGTSGTILSLGGVVMQAETGASVTDIRNCRVSSKGLHKLRKQLVDSDLQERLQVPGLDPRRADLAVAGSVLLDTILRRLGAEDFTLCDLALREGLILDYIRRNKTHIVTIDQYPDIRRRSVEELGQRCNYWSDHARQVARLALALFDQTQPLHGLATAGTRVARIRRAAPRRRRAHQLQEPSQALVLPDSARRPARLRSQRGRSDRPDRALSPSGARRRSRTRATARCRARCAVP